MLAKKLGIPLTFQLLIMLLLFSLLIGSLIGAVQIGFNDLLQLVTSSPQADTTHLWYILLHIRLPRVLAAAFVGGNLALCGVVMQGLLRNPLVDPGILGVMAGASLAVTLSIVLGHHWFPSFFTYFRDYALPVAAFVGSWLMMMLLYVFAKRGGVINISAMLLIGIALSAFIGAIIGVLIYLADDNELRSLTFWGMGSLALFDWPKIAMLIFISIVMTPILWRDARMLNAFMLGEEIAQHTGFDVERAKKRQTLVVAALVGVCVAFSGGIGFIGLVVPHITRFCIGVNHRYVIPASFLLGAILLSLSDTLARTIVAPAELPIGIITACFGAPFLGFLVWKGVR